MSLSLLLSRTCSLMAVMLLGLSGAIAADSAKKLKVFILAGQSNMEGHARIETFDYIGDDPATAPLLKQMRDANGEPAVADHTWISYYTGKYDGSSNGEGFGKLTDGYGSRGDATKSNGKIGPEFMFGLTMDAALKEPVLIIKTAWGGRSLNYNYRPPSAGPYPRTPEEIEKNRNPEAEAGQFYRYMVDHVKHVLADPKRICPAYDESAGYEIAGFVWFQGFNDMVDRNYYPIVKEGEGNRFAKYSELLAHFIRDVRKDLNAPNMPFVIGVMGVGGVNAKNTDFREAMAAPSLLPEFKDNVIAVPTAPFWSEELDAIDQKRAKVKQMSYLLRVKDKNSANKDGSMDAAQQKEYLKKFEAELISEKEAEIWTRGASNAGYHYLGCAKTFALIGKAFAEANLKLLKAQGR